MKSLKIDESLYSRQLYAIGRTAMNFLKESNVFIYGMSGLGVEIAKCIILTGVKSVTLCDNKIVKYEDMSTNYYINETNLGENVLDIITKKLSELNPYVTIKKNKNIIISDQDIQDNDVIVICDTNIENLIKYNKLVRKYKKKFISANTFGLMGNVFCDFGQDFTIDDQYGEKLKSGIISSFCENVVKTYESHNLCVGDYIKIITKESETKSKIIHIYDNLTFQIEQTDEMNFNNTSCLTFVQIKCPTMMEFNSLEESLENPIFSNVFSNDCDRQKKLHDIHMMLESNIDKTLLEKEINNVFSNKKCNIEDNHNDETLITTILNTYNGKLCPVDSIFGGIAAHEIIKAVTHKYIPIQQWLYLDFVDIMNGDNIVDCQKKSRYFSQNIMLNNCIQNNCIFIAGAGAIGCEIVKNLAMIGIKNITICDMDKIEKSNLNRQFLFNSNDIGKFKSEVVKNKISEINSSINIHSFTCKIEKESENIFDSQFYNNVTCIMGALDNIQTRQYIDDKCVENRTCFIDSGTLGTQGSVQTVIPHITESYNASQDPPEELVPLCTLKMFPYKSDHCIQYAKDLFVGTFTNSPKIFIDYIIYI